jgi:hypothetical protein
VTLFGPSAFFLTLLEILFSVNPPAECGLLFFLNSNHDATLIMAEAPGNEAEL